MSIEWYHEAIQDDDGDDDFKGCPACLGENLEYKGEYYDDEEYIGAGYDCLDCGHRFYDLTIYPGFGGAIS